ncbi:hypothetical protein [Streptomyces sp. NRRL S-337]|uniref:hypothetical protein n=1 Tax=Streptomyces sp. NRRL S-337 TaxID=1463900 RepID=UPI00131EBF47|nr:hypothetical protein [Streptomyces sp. NRRL S-337]
MRAQGTAAAAWCGRLPWCTGTVRAGLLPGRWPISAPPRPIFLAPSSVPRAR